MPSILLRYQKKLNTLIQAASHPNKPYGFAVEATNDAFAVAVAELHKSQLHWTEQLPFDKPDGHLELFRSFDHAVTTHLAERNFVLPINPTQVTYGGEQNPLLGVGWEVVKLKKVAPHQFNLVAVDVRDVQGLSKLIRLKSGAKDPLHTLNNLLMLGKRFHFQVVRIIFSSLWKSSSTWSSDRRSRQTPVD